MRRTAPRQRPVSIPNIRHLQLILDVIDRGSVSAVARIGHLSQPAVTQAVASVETALGGKLFEHGVNQLRPTKLGLDAARRIERALRILRDAVEGVRDRSRGPQMGDALRSMSVSQLVALRGVSEHGSVSSAARATRVARATVYRAVRQLERMLGVQLLEDTSFGLRATREAQRLILGARLAFAEIDQARGEIAASVGTGSGGTVIGAMPLARTALLPHAILEFARLRPEHRISILDGPYESMLTALRRGAADVLIGALRDPSPGSDVVQEHLFDDPLAIVFRAGHPLASEGAPALESLAPFPWIAPRTESPLRRQFDAFLARLDTQARQVPIECNSLVAARALLLASDRLMLLSAHQIQNEIQTGQLVARPHPLGGVVRPIGLTRRRDWRPTEVQRQFMEILHRQARKLSPCSSGGGEVKLMRLPRQHRRRAKPAARV